MDTYETSLYTSVAIALGGVGLIIVFFVYLVISFNRRYFNQKGQQYAGEIRVLKTERKRIAHDLHDGISSSLGALKMELDNLGLQSLVLRLSGIQSRLHEIIEHNIPPDFDREDFKTFLGHYLENYALLSNCKIKFNYQIGSELPAEMKMHFYLMIEEMLYNTTKHSGADTINIQMEEKRKMLLLFFEDNGHGFSMNTTNSRGHGLTSLRDRAVIIGGEMYCESAPGKGTAYQFNIPVRKWLPSN